MFHKRHHGTLRLDYEYTTDITFCPAIYRHDILLRCLPSREHFQQSCAELLTCSEAFTLYEGTDALGNRIVYGSLDQQHTRLTYTSRGIIELSTYCIPDPAPHPMYRFPSRLADATSSMLTEVMPIATAASFLDRCIAIMHAVHRFMTYVPQSTDMMTPASSLIVSRRGVCQDYAHLMIAVCRSAGLHARYVCGLMRGEGATHAWVEVHDGQCWYAFDPTNDTAIASGYIKLAHGRDALDCPVLRGIYQRPMSWQYGVDEQTIVRVRVNSNDKLTDNT